MDASVYGGRLLFVAKEAVFKAVADLDQIFLDHHDVDVDFTKHEAVISKWQTRRTTLLHFHPFVGLGFCPTCGPLSQGPSWLRTQKNREERAQAGTLGVLYFHVSEIFLPPMQDPHPIVSPSSRPGAHP